MHPTLATIPTPTHLRPYLPTRTHAVGVRFELGQIAPEPVPSMGYRDDPFVTADPIPHSLEPRPCPACATTYHPKAWNQERCPPCGRAHRLAEAMARKLTARTRRSEPRVRCPAAEKAMATRKVNQATRDRAQRARPRSAA